MGQGFRTFTEQQPIVTSYDGRAYEQELVRACIDRFAITCSKLKPEYQGSKRNLERLFRTYPNPMSTWPQFLYRVATILENENTAVIVPSFDRDMATVNGLYPLLYASAELLEYQGEPWMRFYTHTGDVMAIEYKYVCVLNRYQFQSDVFGTEVEPNSTLDLMQAQENAQKQAVKNGAKIRFIGAVNGVMHGDDLKKKREQFVEDNLSVENEAGLLIYDNTINSLQQVKDYSYTIDPAEMERIEENVFSYYGTNKNILQNKYEEAEWAAFYEGKIEPFAVQLGMGLTKMLLTTREMLGNEISFSSSRLQYASMASKRNMIRDMVDRGMLTLNEGREILQLPKVDNGDQFVIRGEYVNVEDLPQRIDDKPGRDSDKERNFYDDENTDTEESSNTEV